MDKSRIVVILLLLSFNLLGQKDYGFLPPVKTSVAAENRSSICVPSPASDIQWDHSKSFQIQVNEAIDAENAAFGKSYPNYAHPSYNSNDPLDISAKVLKELRRVYQSDGIADLDIEYDLSVIDMARDHSCAMDLDNTFCHTCPSDGSFGDRIINRIGNGCYRSGTENIAWISTVDLESSILRIFYLMMYADVACCNNGHRENFLDCTYTDNTKIGFGIVRGDIQSSSGRFIDSWIMTWDYVTYFSYPNCGDGCNCGDAIGTPLCSATAPIVLPVELYSFSTDQSSCYDVNIYWSTLSETNNDYFKIERSLDGYAWEEVAKIKGAGNSNSINQYEYTDDLAGVGVDLIYYRLVQVDVNGEFTYFDVSVLDRDCDDEKMSIYPNPADNYTYIKSPQKIKSISLYDISGKLIKTHFESTHNKIITTKLQAGIYMLKVEKTDGRTEVIKMIKN